MADDTTGGLTGRSTEATEGGFKAVLIVEGNFVEAKRVESDFTKDDGKPANDQARIILEEAVILKMKPGETEPELRDDKFTIYYGYAPREKSQPHKNTMYVRGFQTSAEELWAKRGKKDKGWKDLLGTRVTMERQSVLLFNRPPKKGSDEEVDKDGKVPVYAENFIFAEASEMDVGDLDDHVRNLIVGLNEPAALRKLLLDNRAKRHTKYKKALDSGKLANMLGLILVDDVFTAVEFGKA